MKYIYAVYT